MGYCISMNNSEFFVSTENVGRFLQKPETRPMSLNSMTMAISLASNTSATISAMIWRCSNRLRPLSQREASLI